MRDEKGRNYCDQCGNRCAAGGVKVEQLGTITARRANFRDETIYCGERCLRNRLMGARTGEDPAEDLQRQVDELRDRLRREREDRAERERRSAEPLDQIGEILCDINEEHLADEIQPGERGDQLRRSLVNMTSLITRRWS